MYKIGYEDMINAIENENTIKIIGKIDTRALKTNKVDSLYYIFPLIERIVLEIYKLLPLSDVEYYQQGTMRSIMELLDKDTNDYFPNKVIDIIKKYYKEDGLRNRLFHPKDEIGTVYFNKDELQYTELNYVVVELINLLKESCKQDNNIIDSFGKIEKMK